MTTLERTMNDDTRDAADNVPGNPKVAPPFSNRDKDPADWVSGDEPMTGAQASYLKTLCEEANEPFDPVLNKAEASRRIDDLKRKTGRGP